MNFQCKLSIAVSVVSISGVLLFGTYAGAAESNTWFLLGREGECAPVSLLAKKGPEFEGIESPAQLAERMRAAGHKAEIKEYKAASRPSVEVRVPEKNIYLMFVKGDLCANKKTIK
jgi:hypothetical protein